MKKTLFLILGLFLIGCSQYKYPHILIATQLGDIELELYPEKAPVTAAAFLAYVDSGYYTNASFYRVLKADELPNEHNTGIIQGGIWQTKQQLQLSIPGIKHESTKQSGLLHTSGTISLARSAPGTASTEFFICIGDQNSLDAGKSGTEDGLGFAAFGKVVKGMPIVRKIQGQNSHGDKFDEVIQIYKIKRL